VSSQMSPMRWFTLHVFSQMRLMRWSTNRGSLGKEEA
jgi:hypothetical protein